MKNYAFFLFVSLFLFACSKENEHLEKTNNMIAESRMETTGSMGGELANLKRPLSGIGITLIDGANNVFTTTTAFDGTWTFSSLPPGDYTLNFEDGNLYEYNNAEYQTIIAEIDQLISSPQNINPEDVMAYHKENSSFSITSTDKDQFVRLLQGLDKIEDVNLPWRYITQADLQAKNYSETTTLNVTITANQNLDLDVVGIYIGDPSGDKSN